MTKLKAEVERLEEFSRRDNLRMYGIPHSRDSRLEDYGTCTQAVTDVLNSVVGPKRWTTDDIARAHRVGQSRDGKPKPKIVKFNRWKFKMTVPSNRQFRDNLENRGTKLANDLTRNQASKFLKTVAAQCVDICLKTRSSLLTLTRETSFRRACKPTKLESCAKYTCLRK